mmetsp:Transcript_10076/g.18154  ORF Transcript_10076/g.18154 Transcript_10076/m.18154 type:complete len:86 (+) Transcript_10076:58-315(+)
MNAGAGAQQGVSAMELMKLEVGFMSDMLHKLSDQCFRKCVQKFGDGNLSRSEAECTDFCIEKYMEATNKVGEIIAVQSQQNAAGM